MKRLFTVIVLGLSLGLLPQTTLSGHSPYEETPSMVVIRQNAMGVYEKEDPKITIDQDRRDQHLAEETLERERLQKSLRRLKGRNDNGLFRPIIEKYFPSHEVQHALKVMECESSNDPNAINGSHIGLFQITIKYHLNRVNGDKSRLFLPEENIRVASEIWKESNWRPWKSSFKCSGVR